MKNLIPKTLVVSSLLFSFHALAGIELAHVANYNQAEGEALWSEVKADKVLPSLVLREFIDDPGSSYASLFPKSFLQEEMFAVCYQDCKKKDVFKKSGFILNGDDQDGLEQTNVYFWLKRYFSFLEERFDFKPEKVLRVLTNRTVKDPTAGKKMRNNAFFNPEDISLSFLPASNGLLSNAMNGKMNRSGYDPSVISHEASHYFFHHLFPNPVNSEISGLNEGFADYIANLHLNNPKVGLVMLRGKILRDASSYTDTTGRMKMYSPRLEVHDLGERVSVALWKTRELVSNKEEFDRQVVEAIREISKNPYATIHSFKAEMMKRIPSLVSSSFKMNEVNTVWGIVLEGSEKFITDTSFFTKPTDGSGYLGFKYNQTISKKFADEMGLDEHNKQGFIFIRDVKLANNMTASLMASEDETITRPYWYVIDNASGNILGIYSLDQKLVTDKEELKEIEVLTNQVSSQNETIADFIKKTKMFADLVQGRGDLTAGYKVKNVQTTPETMDFNGEPTAINRVEVTLKKKFLINLIVGLPDIDRVTVYTTSKPIKTLGILNGQTVIGFKISFANGTSTEMILNKFKSNQN